MAKDPIYLTRQWLEEIISKTKSKEGGIFSIYHQALSLLSQLEKHPALIETIQEGTSILAKVLQALELPTNGSAKFVSKNLESDFLYFMETPLVHLKSLRFSYVEKLLIGLGITLDKKRAGSRINFTYKTFKTSIHLHDKDNGEIDGGRISSLRKFLIEIGFTTKE